MDVWEGLDIVCTLEIAETVILFDGIQDKYHPYQDI